MYIKIGGVRIHIGFFAALLAAILFHSQDWQLYAAGVIGIILHEMTHLAMMISYGCRHPTAEILPGAVSIRSTEFDTLGYRQTAVCLLCAPAVNMFVGGVLLCCTSIRENSLVRYAAFANLTLGTVNLLPLSFLDGGRMLSAYLECRYPPERCRRFSGILDAVCLFLMAAVMAVFALHKSFSLPFFFFFLYCAFMIFAGDRFDKKAI